ncbi:Leucine rich repeat-containing protein [Ferrimonas sediminum]|uniref:Leucine rich repeat-containing protein n=1 Tax=Ferrimonas sediminum TaxID=718193 RepID=A0A1G8VPM7_9GAMM|nr:hypothetical protein [Ferrimonas sediminum]SDJ67893.1 Leucine rich repeat-containing protein [Ferrimonas sediminum]
MHAMELDDLNYQGVLAGIHAEVDTLTYDCEEPLSSWAELARAFPNLRRLHFEDLGNVNGRRLLDAAFFQQFPNLTALTTSLRPRRSITTDFSGVPEAHLAQVATLSLGRCRGENLQLLSALPELTDLTMRVDAPEVTFHLSADSVLTNLALGLGSRVRRLDCRLSASSLTTLSLGKLDYYDEPAEPVRITMLTLPKTLDHLTLDMHCQGPLPPRLLEHNHPMASVTLKLGNVAPPDQWLGSLSQVGQLMLSLSGETAPLPSTLFASLKLVDKLELRFEHTPIPDSLLPDGLAVKELFYTNANGMLNQTESLRLPRLQKAWFFGVDGNQLGWLAHSPRLQELNLQLNGELTHFPLLPALRWLTLRGGEMAELPEGIRHCASLETLNLLSVSLPRFGEMAAMTKLSRLWLQPRRQEQDKLPRQSDLLAVPSLSGLRLDIELKRFDPAWASLPQELELDISDEKLAKAWEIFKQSHLSDEETLAYLTALALVRKPAQLPKMPANFHLVMMAAKHNRFKAQHKAWLAELAQNSHQQRPFGPGAILFVSGRSAFKASELKAKAGELGFTLSKTLDDQVTHLLLGSAPREVHRIDLQKYAVIDDAVLQQCFEARAPKFLQQGNEAMEGSILEMLKSPQEASHRVAVQMLEQGGVTGAMRLPLFFILKTTIDNGFRKRIKHLLAGMGDEAFQLAVNDRILFHNCRGRDDYGNLKGQGVMVDKLKRQRKKWGEALCTDFTKLYFDRFGEGLMFVLMQKECSEQRLAILDTLVEGECLNWRRGAGFDKVQEFWDKDSPSNLHWHPGFYLNASGLLGAAKTELPAELAQRHTLTELNLGNCLLSSLPKGMEHYRHIRRLSLANNCLTTLPASLVLFSELDSLDLSYNHFREFPKVLMKMTWLKRLDIRRATRPDLDSGYGADYAPLSIPQAFLDACPDCDVLKD